MFCPFDDTPGRLAAYQYLEELIVDQRVLEIGCGDGLGLGRLLALEARDVVGLNDDIEQARRALGRDRDGLRLRVWQPPRLPFANDSFDLVLLSDARLAAAYPSLVEEMIRVLTSDGRAVFRSPSTDHPQIEAGLSYGELLDLAEPHFDQVRVIGQCPFVGYSLVELTEEEQDPEVQLDGGLLDGDVEEVVAYVVVCGGPAQEVFPYGVVQFPSGAQGAPAAEPLAAQRVAKPAEKPVPEQPARPAAKPESGPAAKPTAESASKSAAKPATKPIAQAEVTPVPEPEDLAAYTDHAGGRRLRWQWPRHLSR